MNGPEVVNLCSRCCEVRCSPHNAKEICFVRGTEVTDDRPWSEGQDPHDVCESYRGPLGFDWDEWGRRFVEAFAKEARRALDEGTLRPSEIVRALG